MTPHSAQIGARLRLSGTLEFKDAEGNVLKTMELTGSVPLEELGLTQEQATELVAQQSKE